MLLDYFLRETLRLTGSIPICTLRRNIVLI